MAEEIGRKIDSEVEKASEVLKGISSATTGVFNAKYGSVVSSIVNNQPTWYNLIRKVDRFRKDNTITAWRTHSARNTTADTYTEGADFSGSEGNQSYAQVYANLKNIKVETKISGLAEAGAAGGDSIDDLWLQEFTRGAEDLADALEQQMFGKEGSCDPTDTDLWDMGKIVDNTDAAVVYNLTRTSAAATNYMDASSVNGNSATLRDVQESHIDTLIREIEVATGRRPTIFASTHALRDSVEGLYKQSARYVPQSFELQAGFLLMGIKGIPFYCSQHAYDRTLTNKSSMIYGLNRADFELRHIGWNQIIEYNVGDTKKAMVKSYPQHCCLNLRTQGKVYDLQ